MQLTIHDAHLKKVAFIDNEKPKTLNFYDDTWTRNLQTGSSTYEFSISKKQLVSDTVLERTYNYLNERSFVSFEYKGKTYLFNVMTVEEDEKKIKCYCENLNLELINEYSNAYEADRAMTFVEYCNAMDLLSMPKLSIGINEISDYKRTLKWEGQDTKLARLISLANKFDAEIDFETFLNADSTIKSFLVNVYHENDGNYHGVGRVRKDITLVYGKNLKSIKRKIDKTGIFNMTVPSSSDTVEDEPIDTGESSAKTVEEHITLSGLPDWEIKNDSGVVEFYKRGDALYAPISAQLYPSTFTSGTQGDQWIRRDLTFDVETDTQLQTEALKQLKAAAYPELTYEFDGYIDADIGDTVQISDSGFTNMLLLEARIFQQKLSFSSEKNWKTTLGNFKALQNMLSSDIQAELEKLVDDAKPYTIRVSSDKGISFKNGEGESTIKATLWKGNKVLDTDVTWRWALDGNVSVGMQYLARAENIDNTAVLTVSAYIGNNEVATTEITLTNVNDGAKGAKGDKGETGNGIANTVITYGLSTSETTEPATWASNMPVLVKGMYLWTRTVQIYTNGTSSTSYQKGYIAKDGAQGLPGTPGKDAQTQYTHIAYADNATGGGFSQTDQTKPYIGMYQDFTATDSNDPTKYRWTKWKGSDGAQGIPGKAGADGKTPYIHFAYADDNKGTNLSFTDKNQQYQGYYSDYTEANSTDYKKYTWVDRLANVKGGSRNYFKNSLTKTFYTTDAQTFDWRTYIVDAFWKNKDRLKKNFVKISFDITFPVALENDYTANIHFSATPWYSNKVTFKAGTTSRQHFEFGIDLSSASENYHTDNVFIRFGTNYGFPSGFKIILENMMLSIGSYYPDYIQAIEDTQEQIDSKADSALTQEQLNALAEKNRTLEAELEAKAALATVEAWKEAYDNYVAQNETDKAVSEANLVTATNRIAALAEDWQDKKVSWSFLDTHMDFQNEGLILGKKGSPTTIRISNDRIAFYSGGTEVASMSEGTLTIDNGIFAKSLQIGHFREEVYESDSNINVIRWVD